MNVWRKLLKNMFDRMETINMEGYHVTLFSGGDDMPIRLAKSRDIKWVKAETPNKFRTITSIEVKK